MEEEDLEKLKMELERIRRLEEKKAELLKKVRDKKGKKQKEIAEKVKIDKQEATSNITLLTGSKR